MDSSEEAFFWKKHVGDFVVARELTVLGDFRLKLAIAEKAVLVGRGDVGVLICDECALLSMKGPITIDMLKAGSALLIGGRHPIVITRCEAKRALYAYRSLIGDAEGETIVMGAMSSIRKLKRFRRLIFTDPHSYIEEIIQGGESGIFIY